MSKPLKLVLIVAGTLLVLIIGTFAFIAATFDPNDYKPQLIRLVQEKTQRTLSIPGEIRLSVFPKIGATFGPASLSQRNSTDEFAAVGNAKLSLALLPLLRQQFIVDRVTVDGLRVNLRRFRDGSTNVDDLLQPGEQEESSQAVQFAVEGIAVNDAALSYRDEQAGRDATLTDFDMRTGPIADGRDSTIELTGKLTDSGTTTAAAVELRSGFTLHLADKRYVIRGLDATATGKAAGMDDLRLAAKGNADLRTAASQFTLDGIELAIAGKQTARAIDARLSLPKLSLTADAVQGGGLTGSGKITEGTRTVDLKLGAPAFQGSPKSFSLAGITLDAAVSEPGLQATARISTPLQGNIETLRFQAPQLVMTLDGKQGDRPVKGSVRTAVTADLSTQRIEAGNLGIDLQLPHPQGGTMAFQANGDASADLAKQSARATLKGSLDGAAWEAKLGASDFSKPAIDVDATIAALDVDRYLAADKPAAATQARPAGKNADAPDDQAADKPIDLSALKTLDATAKLRIGSLKVSGLKASNVSFTLRATNGKADIHPLSANLYGGSLTGALSATAAEQPRFAIRQTLSGVQIGPLLKDLMDKDILDGRGRVTVDVTTAGATVPALKKALAGSAQLSLQDGAIRGVNIAGAIRQAKTRLGVGANTSNVSGAGTPAAAEKTDFTELNGSFRIANGIARNDDLDAKSPLLRITGAGNVDIGADRIDYLVKATVVSTLQGQGGPELQALRGVTIPVRLTGPYDAIAWNVDVAGMASELAKAKVEEKRAEVEAQVQKKVGEQRGKIEEEVRGRLKGLLGQ